MGCYAFGMNMTSRAKSTSTVRTASRFCARIWSTHLQMFVLGIIFRVTPDRLDLGQNANPGTESTNQYSQYNLWTNLQTCAWKGVKGNASSIQFQWTLHLRMNKSCQRTPHSWPETCIKNVMQSWKKQDLWRHAPDSTWRGISDWFQQDELCICNCINIAERGSQHPGH